MQKTSSTVSRENVLLSHEITLNQDTWTHVREARQKLVSSKGEAVSPVGIRPEIADSWLRSYRSGIDPGKHRLCEEISEENYHAQLHSYEKLIAAVEPLMKMVDDLEFSEDYIFELVGRNGLTLLQKGNLRLHRFVSARSVFNEATMGTNAHSLCMRYKKVFRVSGPEHYCHALDNLEASAIPIKDEQDNVLASLLFTSLLPDNPWSEEYNKLYSQVVGLLSSMSSAVENKLRAAHYYNQVQRLEGAIQDLQKAHGSNGFASANGSAGSAGSAGSKGSAGSAGSKGSAGSAADTQKPGYGETVKITFKDILGPSEDIKRIIDRSKRFAATKENILLTGESGTGKEYFAQAIHNHSCPQGPFMSINCAAIPPRLIESELFGYEGGSFTGAERGGKPGKIELADKGTLFLDEIGDMPLELQATLLRVLENKRVMRLGGKSYKQVDFRVLAATNKDLYSLVQQGTFREDLYYRLSILTINLPALRQRRDDLRFFIDYFLHECQAKDYAEKRGFSPEVITMMINYAWPGNIRQLRNTILSAYHGASGDVIMPEDLPPYLTQSRAEGLREPSAEGISEPVVGTSGLPVVGSSRMPAVGSSRLPAEGTSSLPAVSESRPAPLYQQPMPLENYENTSLSMQEIERAAIELALLRADNNVAQAAELLKISKATLYRKLKGYGS